MPFGSLSPQVLPFASHGSSPQSALLPSLSRFRLPYASERLRPPAGATSSLILHISSFSFFASLRLPAQFPRRVLSRKEVIQPHLPVRLPCYDFVPVTSPTFDSCLLTVSPPASGVTSSHDVTGGVYKARERIHRSMADLRLLATPAS